MVVVRCGGAGVVRLGEEAKLFYIPGLTLPYCLPKPHHLEDASYFL